MLRLAAMPACQHGNRYIDVSASNAISSINGLRPSGRCNQCCHVLAHVENEPGPAFIWRKGRHWLRTAISPPGSKPRKAVLRMDTDEGDFGVIEMGRGDAIMDLVRRRYPHFIGENPLLSTERMWNLMWEIDRIEEEVPYATRSACSISSPFRTSN